MLTWDEDIKPALPSFSARGSSDSRLLHSPASTAAVAGILHRVSRKSMIDSQTRISQTVDPLFGDRFVCAPEFMMLGLSPTPWIASCSPTRVKCSL